MKRFLAWLFGNTTPVKGIPVQIDGFLIGYLNVTDETAHWINGKQVKVVWIPNRIINIVTGK